MENNLFVYCAPNQKIEINRLHICTWEFKNNSAILELGGEINNPLEIEGDNLQIKVYIPWITTKFTINDLYPKLRESDNCRFIFNDSVTGNIYLDDGQRRNGVIHDFANRLSLCILPIITSIDEDTKTLTVDINLRHFKATCNNPETNIYFRLYIEPSINLISTRKSGINQSTIIYDMKVNEKRNLPVDIGIEMNEVSLSTIKSCFFFNILPNSYEPKFFDSSSLQNIRNLEYKSFIQYMDDTRVKKDELVVVFNKKVDSDSYAFFAIYSKERIGAGQFALAVLINLVCGILLFIPSYRKGLDISLFSKDILYVLPVEVYIASSIGLSIVAYFLWPKIMAITQIIKNRIKKRSSSL